MSNIPESVLPETIQAKMRKEIRKSWNIEKFDKQIKRKLKIAIIEYCTSNRTKVSTEYKLAAIKKNVDQDLAPTIQAYQAVLAETYENRNYPISELEWMCSFIHPLMKSLFGSEDPLTIPPATDKANSAGITSTNCRPDYLVSVYDNGHEAYNSVIGEAKAESASKRSITKDLSRITLFAKDILDKNNMEAVIGFQSVGPKVTFYFIQNDLPKLYTFTEICKITLPKKNIDMLSFIDEVNKLHMISSMHKKLCIKSSSNKSQYRCRTISLQFVKDKTSNKRKLD